MKNEELDKFKKLLKDEVITLEQYYKLVGNNDESEEKKDVDSFQNSIESNDINQANSIADEIENSGSKPSKVVKFYEKTWFFVVICIFTPYIALPFMFIKKKEIKGIKKILLAIFLGMFSLIIIGMRFVSVEPKKINLADYTTTTFVGYSGAASDDTIQFDSEKMLSDFPSLKSKWKTTKLTYTIDDEYDGNKLKNGDRPCYIYTISNEEELKDFEFDKKVCFTVENLISKEEYEKNERDRVTKERAEKEAIEKKKKEEKKKTMASFKEVSYKKLARDPDKYLASKIKLSGKIIQVIEGTDSTQYRMAVNGNYDSIVLLEISSDKLKRRILENDQVTVRGLSLGTMTYESTMGGNITIPACMVEYFNFN